jgi:hypothetical protein
LPQQRLLPLGIGEPGVLRKVITIIITISVITIIIINYYYC